MNDIDLERRYADLIAHYSGYKAADIMRAAKDKARAYREATIYFLRAWESKARDGGFNLDRERY